MWRAWEKRGEENKDQAVFIFLHTASRFPPLALAPLRETSPIGNSRQRVSSPVPIAACPRACQRQASPSHPFFRPVPGEVPTPWPRPARWRIGRRGRIRCRAPRQRVCYTRIAAKWNAGWVVAEPRPTRRTTDYTDVTDIGAGGEGSDSALHPCDQCIPERRLGRERQLLGARADAATSSPCLSKKARTSSTLYAGRRECKTAWQLGHTGRRSATGFTTYSPPDSESECK